jgi:hypothetical protein
MPDSILTPTRQLPQRTSPFDTILRYKAATHTVFTQFYSVKSFPPRHFGFLTMFFRTLAADMGQAKKFHSPP